MFNTFNFLVELVLDGGGGTLCSAGFSDCDGLEMTMDAVTYQEGGDNAGQVHLVGPVSYGQLTLKRGMTDSFDLWNWFDRVMQGEYNLRASGTVVMLSQDHATEQARFLLTRCLPVKLRAPALSAQTGLLAIEEMQVAYERMRLEQP